jgi:hypothetical protein
MNLGVGLIAEIGAMGGKDVWLMLRPNAVGVSYLKDGERRHHAVALPFGELTDTALATLLEMADEDFAVLRN